MTQFSPRRPVGIGPIVARGAIVALAAVTLLVPASARASREPSPAFAARQNPFAYAGEYRDPTWGGVYLRARWYAPALPTFTGRDAAMEQVNHYGYGGGNPLMHVDPSGLHYDVERSTAHALGTLTQGGWGNLSRIALGPAIGIMQLIAAPQAFWHALAHDTQGIDVFLAAGAVLEAASMAAPSIKALRFLPSGGRWIFRGHVGLESALGLGQTLTASLDSRTHRFSGSALLQGLEYTYGSELTYRVVGGLGYQPFLLRPSDVEAMVERELTGGSGRDALVFRAQVADLGPRRFRRTWTTPLLETTRLGLYHEKLVGVGAMLYVADVDPVAIRYFNGFGEMVPDRYGRRLRFEYLGKRGADRVELHFAHDNVRNLPMLRDDVVAQATGERPVRNAPGWIRNNCHDHAAGLRGRLGL